MIKQLMTILSVATLLLSADAVRGAEPQSVTPNYNLAEQFSPTKMRRLVPQTAVSANWFAKSNKFWYQWQSVDDITYYIVDPAARTKREMWSMSELAEKVTMATKYPFDAQHLPIYDIELKDDNFVLFDIAPYMAMVENNDYTPVDEEGMPIVFHFKWDIAKQELELIDEREQEIPEWANVSPDGRIAVYEKNSNLWYMSMEDVEKFAKNPQDSTIVEHQITTDAVENTAYHWFEDCIEQIKPDERYRVYLQWSPDSKHFATVRSDVSALKDFWVINILKERPELFSYKYQMPGEETPKFWLELFDTETFERR
jgi:hypothetical protein